MTKHEQQVVRAAMGKQWDILALWIERGCPFTPAQKAKIVSDIRELGKACARLARKK